MGKHQPLAFNILFLSLIVNTNVKQYQSTPLSKKLAKVFAVADLGSTGSRIKLYVSLLYNEELKKINCDNCFTNPGLSSYARNPSKAADSIEIILKAFISRIKRLDIPLNKVFLTLSGTGGLRSIPDKRAVKEILSAVSDRITSYGIPHSFPKVISSTKEAYFALIGLHYIENQSNKPNKNGALELGGRSAQIALFGNDNCHLSPNISFSAYQKDIHMKQLFEYSKARLIETGACRHFEPFKFTKNGKGFGAAFACGFDGLGVTRIHEYVEENTRFKMSSPCHPKGSKTPKGKKGYFDYEKCDKIILKFIKEKVKTFKDQVKHIKELMRQESTEQGILKMYGLANIRHTGKFFESVDSLSNMNKESKDVCSKKWETIRSENPGVPDKFLNQYCLNAVYINRLITDFFWLKEGKNRRRTMNALNEDEPKIPSQFHMDDTVGNTEVDWTLGDLLTTGNEKMLNDEISK